MNGIEAWWEAGEHVVLELRGAERGVFVRRLGEGPHMTLLHGFPSSSHDWAKVAPGLAEQHELLMPDFLGYGASDKPRDHAYSLLEQADLVEALWDHEGVDATILVGHDYAVSVVQELLARRAEGALRTALEQVHLLNGGLYPEFHRAQPVQEALLDPAQGPQVSAAMNEELFVAGLRQTFPDDYEDAGADSAAIWRSMARDDGQLNAHLLIRYILDRREHRDRWVGAIESTDVPLAFVWGMLDPVSGAHMAERISERIPHARLLALEDVGHWPALEAPARVASALRG